MSEFKNSVKEKIREYSNEDYLNEYIKREFLTTDDTADIFLKINNKNDVFDTKTYGNQLDINSEIFDYIEEKTAILNNDIKLNLRILVNDLDNDDKEKIRKIIAEHYAFMLYKAQKEYRSCKKKILGLFLIGVAFLLGYSYISIKLSQGLFSEIFGFMFSFALWQAFETIIYTLNDLVILRESITQKLLMNITFEKEI